MCIILTCEQNVRPTHELLETCFWNNPDGAGIMYVEDGKVQVEKGFMDLEFLEDAIDSIPKNSRLVIHMRIATSGGINSGTCHPFPICDDLDLLHAPYSECDAALVHNGIISHMYTDAKRGISDTVSFVSSVVNNLYLSEGLTKSSLRRIKRAAPGNRFAIMTSDGKVYRLGEGWNTITKGIQASNKTWQYEKQYATYDTRWSTWSLRNYCYGERTSYYYYGEDQEELEYLYDFYCGNCKCKGTCMAYGPTCDDIGEMIEDNLAWWNKVQAQKEEEEELVLID